ncbi:MAG TPA: ABC transporter permease, partial [Candidatus Dormibacteraeota bacterium]|nr:ABC transporter permease [Candidatus Dormibacteraeota bacterium]
MKDRAVPSRSQRFGEIVVAPIRPTAVRRLPARVIATYVASVAVGIGLWQLLSLHTIAYFLPSPVEVVRALVKLYGTGQLLQDVEISTFRILTGWALGIVVGVPLGLVMGWWPFTRRLFDPYVEFFRFIPPIAFVSLAIIWFGIGETSKVVLIFYTTVFIITLN